MSDRRQIFKQFEENKAYLEDRIKTGIEAYRKGLCSINIKDSDGNPVTNATVKINQKSHEFKFGANIFMLDELETEEKNQKYKDYFKDVFNIATLPFYWSGTEPEQGKTRYTKDSPKLYRRPNTDLCLEFCEKYGIEPREHALAYEHTFPDWICDKPTHEIRTLLSKRMKEIAERYADRIPIIEVTNEHEWPKGKTAFYEETDYIEWCYKEARKYFPGNKLGINEWACMWPDYGRTRDGYYKLIENLLLKGAPIDLIGMQFHLFYRKEVELEKTEKYYNPYQIYKILDRYSDFNKPIEITEVTIPAYSYEQEDEEIQAEMLKILYSIWFSHKSVDKIIYWNLVDGYAAFAPLGDMTSGENYYRGGLIRFDFTPKPSFVAIKNLIQKEWHTAESLKTNENGQVNFKGFFGKYDIEISIDGKTVNKEINFPKPITQAMEITL